MTPTPQVVDCPEFLVHFPTLVKLAERYGLMMIGKQRFQNYFQVLYLSPCHLAAHPRLQQRKEHHEGKGLLGKMNALETFPTNKQVSQPSCQPVNCLLLSSVTLPCSRWGPVASTATCSSTAGARRWWAPSAGMSGRPSPSTQSSPSRRSDRTGEPGRAAWERTSESVYFLLHLARLA